MSQLSLFGGGSDGPAQTADEWGAIPVPDPSLVSLAAKLPKQLRLGTCSWTFPGWDLVYRREYGSDKRFRTESLAEYAAFPLFRAVEIDSTYYGPPNAQGLRNYAAKIREGWQSTIGSDTRGAADSSDGDLPDFECAMKVWSEITTFAFPRHKRFGSRAGMRNANFLDPQLFASTVIAPIEEAGFGPLGPLILEIPPIPKGALDRAVIVASLGRFLAQAPEGYRYAVEVRDPELLDSDYFAVLRDHGAAHVYSFHSRMPPLAEQLDRGAIGEAPFVVSRLMLPPGASYQEQKDRFEPFDRLREPQRGMRNDVVRLISDAAANDIPTYVFCNNKAEGSSPHTAIAIADQLAKLDGGPT